uniref:RNA-directed DNA polymerase, eukaryota n=1 Tax=Tanacetum cinerariifolium TaxID=118510 RepID=A0A6L2LDF4_TANCI|nr:RNA-directed DNA polymerase, eukaryota [Tanacetum cinerariifolium]
MSPYSNKLSKEIRFLQDSISRNNEQIKLLKEELLTGNNVFSRQSHKGRTLYLIIHNLDSVSLIHSKLGNGANVSFWEVTWRGRSLCKSLFPRLYALETQKKIDVASKLSHSGLDVSFRCPPRGGVEIQQFEHMKEKVEGCILADMLDRWFWALEGSGEFTITSVRKMIDDFMLPEVSSKTRWIKAVPIKVNVHACKVKLDGLPTRLNISRRGIDIESILCPMCGKAVESTNKDF